MTDGVRPALSFADDTVTVRVRAATGEKALALTHLEEVMFWSNAGIARQGT